MFDVCGEPLIASHACKGSRRYRYYVSRPGSATDRGPAVRIPAIELEQAVAECIAAALDEPLALVAWLGVEASAMSLPGLFERAAALAASLRAKDKRLLQEMTARVDVADTDLQVKCDGPAIGRTIMPEAEVTVGTPIALTSEVQLQRSGLALRLVQNSGAAVGANPSCSLIKLLLKARRWWRILRTEEITITALARREGVTRSYVCRIVRLAFLAPAVVEAILAGTARAGVDAGVISAAGGMEPLWSDQEARLLPSDDGGPQNSGRKPGHGLRVVVA